jgi:hypothetical protein
MSDERPDEQYNIQKGAPGFTCCACECDTSEHVCGWKCPIFNKELICSQCCLVDVLRKDTPKIFSARLGREITREEINKMCGDCGRNHAVEDDTLADQIQSSELRTNKETSNDSETSNG